MPGWITSQSQVGTNKPSEFDYWTNISNDGNKNYCRNSYWIDVGQNPDPVPGIDSCSNYSCYDDENNRQKSFTAFDSDFIKKWDTMSDADKKKNSLIQKVITNQKSIPRTISSLNYKNIVGFNY